MASHNYIRSVGYLNGRLTVQPFERLNVLMFEWLNV